MMLGMLVLDVRQVVKDVAMQDVLDKGPAPQTDDEREAHGEPPLGRPEECKCDQDDGQGRVDVEIGEKAGATQVHGTLAELGFESGGGRVELGIRLQEKLGLIDQSKCFGAECNAAAELL